MNRFCPICRRFTMQPAGIVRAGPRRGKRRVFMCKRCGYRRIV